VQAIRRLKDLDGDPDARGVELDQQIGRACRYDGQGKDTDQAETFNHPSAHLAGHVRQHLGQVVPVAPPCAVAMGSGTLGRTSYVLSRCRQSGRPIPTRLSLVGNRPMEFKNSRSPYSIPLFLY